MPDRALAKYDDQGGLLREVRRMRCGHIYRFVLAPEVGALLWCRDCNATREVLSADGEVMPTAPLAPAPGHVRLDCGHQAVMAAPVRTGDLAFCRVCHATSTVER